jgi:uncharacterized membrane protein YcaP (DUF421 family)
MDIIIRAVVIFLFVWFVLRALGKRELGEMTAFELVLLFVIGDLVQQSITQDDTSVTAAILAISTIALLIVVQSYAVFRWKRVRPVLEGEPVVVVADGHVVESTLRRERMSISELKGSARQQGIDDLTRVQFAVLETSGKLSFLTAGPDEERHAGEEHLTG